VGAEHPVQLALQVQLPGQYQGLSSSGFFMWEVWEGDLFLFLVENQDEALRYQEAGFSIRNVDTNKRSC
jgi:hypothetical protein